jgi:D-tyrosyl-tRNA(Tyr) deacylase
LIALIQRVSYASVLVDEIIAEIDQGILAFIGVEKNDTKEKADKLLHRLLGYRIFSDNNDKMNLGLDDVKGGLLLVPQFTLAADTKKGMRPSFSSAALPELGNQLFDYFVKQAKTNYPIVETGEFGADMKVSLCNDGPVTFWLQV